MSFNIALTGLNATSEQLNTISNNISNANTTGFKSSRTEFGSVYADTQAMGVEVLRNTQSITLGGSLVNTNRNLDLAISGGGFFIVKDPATQEEQFTRAGAFSLGLAGDKTYLIDAAGKRVQGVTGDIEIVTSDMAAEATDSLAFVANFDANKTAIDPVAVPFDPDSPATYHSSYTSRVFDSQGKEHSLTQYFRKVADNQWEAYSYLDGSAATPASTVMEFTTSGQLDNVGGAGTTVAFNFAMTGVEPLDITVDYVGSTQYGIEFNVTKDVADGFTSGTFVGIAVNTKGEIVANYSNGQSNVQGKLLLANFTNPEGLRAVSGTAWVATDESGTALKGEPGVGQRGSIYAAALENSNVDLTEELVNLMQGQRNYQANTKVISTQKDLDQILFSAM